MTSENEVELTWQPVADALEPTAVAEKYIVYTRIGDGDFDNGVLVDGITSLNVSITIFCKIMLFSFLLSYNTALQMLKSRRIQ